MLSQRPGIYLFLGRNGDVLYVGKAKNLRKRVASYFANYVDLGDKTRSLVSQIKKIKVFTVTSEIEALLLEANYIKKFKPKYNIRLTDGKSYPLIRITIKDKYPKIVIARNRNDKSSIYFGPYPNSSALKLVLKLTRRIFPYQSVLNHTKKICLYYHLGLCPCPYVFDTKDLRKEYRKNIQHIISFLEGRTKKVVGDLEKEKNKLVKKEEFEKANVIQNKINAIHIITDPLYKKKVDNNINPNLEEDLRSSELSELKSILKKNNTQVLDLERIECFDISNILGTNATGSMVVFINGEKDGSKYRKFKIKTIGSPNDFGMIEEVLRRRLSHKEWPMPDLLIVDGGKGQVSSALKVLAMKQFGNLTIPVIGLAKQFETIVTSDFKEISLPKESSALKLIMRIRDEAHRFAITYHKKLRSKTFLR